MSPISCILYQALLTGTGMNLDSLAYFLPKNLVEIPRLMLLTIAYLSTFIHYPQIIFCVLVFLSNNNIRTTHRYILSRCQSNCVLFRILLGVLFYSLEHYRSRIYGKCCDGTKICTVVCSYIHTHHRSVLWSRSQIE